MSPSVSVVIPTYNRARRAAAALRSVLAQTDGDFECWVVDDGSTDDTRTVLSAFKDPRLHLVFNGTNQGQHVCRNQAIRASSAPWIAFLDSDDLFLPERLCRLRQACESRPKTGFWFTNAYIHRYGRIIGTLFDPARAIPEGKVPGWYAVGDKHLPYVTTTVMVRREAFEKTGYFRRDLRILEDTELYARMLKDGLEVGAVREPLAVRFLHEGQITRDYWRDYMEALEALHSGSPHAKVEAQIKRELAFEVGEYLWRALKPDQARAFLLEALGEGARRTALYRRTFLPPALLSVGRAGRELYLRLRHHPMLAGPELRGVYRTIAPWL
ncbi:MAG: glycosyltransferase family 2 protein [Elusimicrobia bacterium]|nr:glycosyltransferase family 2 protein [Elusimicrobiota bacterium]